MEPFSRGSIPKASPVRLSGGCQLPATSSSRGPGECGGGAHPSRGSGHPLSSSPEAAAFLRWAISSLLCSRNANSRAAWKEVMLPEHFRSA